MHHATVLRGCATSNIVDLASVFALAILQASPEPQQTYWKWLHARLCQESRKSALRRNDMLACEVQVGRERAPLKVNQSPNISTTAVSADKTEASSAQASTKPAFENKQRFYVPEDVKEHFEAAWAARHAYMKTQRGFVSFNISEVDDSYTVTSKWASIPEWEAFNLSKEARRHHLPWVRPQSVSKNPRARIKVPHPSGRCRWCLLNMVPIRHVSLPPGHCKVHIFTGYTAIALSSLPRNHSVKSIMPAD